MLVRRWSVDMFLWGMQWLSSLGCKLLQYIIACNLLRKMVCLCTFFKGDMLFQRAMKIFRVLI